MKNDPYPLGRPGDDVEEAARLLLRYEAEHPLSSDLKRSFLMMCGDGIATAARAAQLRSSGWRWDKALGHLVQT